MTLPATLNKATPAGSESPALGDDRIRELKEFIEDVFGVPDNTAIAAAIATITAAGLTELKFQNSGFTATLAPPTLTANGTFPLGSAIVPSVVRGAIGGRTSTSQWTLSSAGFIAFFNPATRVIEKLVVDQGTLTVDATVAGPVANGRDQAGAFTASSWLYLYYIYKPSTDTKALILSTTTPHSTNAGGTLGPVLPTDYTMWAFITAARWNSIPAFYEQTLRGSLVFYDDFTGNGVLSAGTAASFTAVATTLFCPPDTVAQGVIVGLNLAGGASGAGAFSLVLNIGWDATSASGMSQFGINLTIGGAGTQAIFVGPYEYVNAGQQLYYKAARGGTATDVGAYIYVAGYRSANGG